MCVLPSVPLSLLPSSNSLSSGRKFLAGSLAGCTASTLTYPLDMVRARMAITQRSLYRNLFHAFWSIQSKEGVATLYRGITPTLMGVVPYAGFSFLTYETLKDRYQSSHDTPPGPLPRLLYGASAGLIGQSASYPLDIVRRRMQTQGVASSVQYRTIWWTLMYVLNREGVRGLYKGMTMNWIKGPIAVSISFNTYDHVKSLLRRLLDDRGHS